MVAAAGPTYDVVVVGGGVVGCAVAQALSHHRLSVLLLEAWRRRNAVLAQRWGVLA